MGDPERQSLAGVGIPEGDAHQGRVLDPCQVVHAELVGHGRRVVVVGVLDVVDRQD